MNRTLTLLQKAIVRIYYVENTSFFLLIIGLAGGFMSGIEHRALAGLFVSSPFTMLIPIGIWAIYALKVINFNNGLLRRNENEFLFYFILYPHTQKLLLAWSIGCTQFMPAFLYGVFLIGEAAKNDAPLAIALSTAALIALSIFIAAVLYQNLHHANQEKKISAWRKWLNRYVTRPYPLFSLEWISRQSPALIIGTKIFASAILFGVLALYNTDTYDFRLLALGTIVAAAISAQLVGELHRFDTFHFTLPLQLPLSPTGRITNTFACIALIYLPETGMLITYFPTYLSRLLIVESVTCLWGVAWLWYALHYQKHRTPDSMSKIIFACTIAWIVAALFSIPLWAITTVNLVFGFHLWNKFFYHFEPAIEEK